ncbi:MAG: membrane protein insertion efficiency factor YidD [Clostridia bacterium]|nr:membrane protein insertion efficiency factor YidD [Clostridia bacterium]
MKWICIGLLRLYKLFLSPFIGKNCLFYPTCSVYSMEAYRVHGFFRGSWLTAKRLVRCGPWSKGGFDPIPYKFGGSIKWVI